jgi:hypothetical protein
VFGGLGSGDGDLASACKIPLTETGHLFTAYELTLRALNLADRNDPLTALIAEKIIEIGAIGLKDPLVALGPGQRLGLRQRVSMSSRSRRLGTLSQ